MQCLLKDKRTPKNKIWQRVYKKMIKLGFQECESSKEEGMKCNQKCWNLEKNYVDLKKNSRPK